MNEQEREQIEYEMGWATEAQNCHTIARMEIRDDPRISESLSRGKFVLFTRYTVFSRFDDSIAGHRDDFVSEHDTWDEANEARRIGDSPPDVDYLIEPGKPVPPKIATRVCNDDEIPF